MAQHAHYTSLVYQHNTTGPQPPILSASGTTALSSDQHEMTWHAGDSNSSSSSASSSVQSPTAYSLARSADHEYSAQASPPTLMSRHPFPSRQHSAHYDSRQAYEEALTSRQDEGSIGPDRGVSRRRNARQEQAEQAVAGYSRPLHSLAHVAQHSSRPPSPVSPDHSIPYYADVPGHSSSGLNMMPTGSRHQSSPVASYPPYQYMPSHSRSTSGSISTSNPRSASPALSVASALTSVSSHGNPASSSSMHSATTASLVSTNMAPRTKNKKQRLYNVDRKKICQYALEHPNLKQEDIARQFNVERSTVSKILKQKAKWMHVPDEEKMLIAKQRPSKFPWIERPMEDWVVDCTEKKVPMTDAMIRNKAREIARNLGWPEEKFKASSGWVENFKHRHGIRKGVWSGIGKVALASRANGAGANHFPGLEGSSVDYLPSLPPDPRFDNPPLMHLQDVGRDVPDEVPAEAEDGASSQFYHARRHPVWQSPEQSGDVEHRTQAPPSQHLEHSSQSANDHLYRAGSPPPAPILLRHENGHSDDNGPEVALVQPAQPHVRQLVGAVPASHEVEDAMDLLLRYCDHHGNSFLTWKERDTLQSVKHALFCFAGNTLYNRPDC